jgi:mRNA interferase MazF
VKRGDVWRVSIPIAPGHAQTGERPAIIIQDDAFNARLPTTLIVPFTSSGTGRRYPGTLLVQPDGHNGLSVPSLALVFQMRVVDKRDCLRQLGTLDQQTLDQVFAILDQLTGR